MFAFRSRPFKILYIIYAGLTVLFIRLPYWVIISGIPACKPRRSWPMKRVFLVRFLKAFLNIAYAIGFFPRDGNPVKDSKAPNKTGFVWVDEVPQEFIKGDVAEMAKIDGVASAVAYGYWFGKRGSDGKHAQRAAPGERVYYHLHGGGFIMGSGAPGSIASDLASAVREKLAGTVDRFFCVDYRLSVTSPFPTKNPFPAALIDALSGYYYLTHTIGFSPRDIIIGGDSAGAHLATIFVRYLASESILSLPIPRALLLFSPMMDWEITHNDGSPTASFNANAATDCSRIILESGYTARAIRGSLDPSCHTYNSWLYPTSLKLTNSAGIFKGFPSTCIVAGGAEVARDEMRTLRDRLVRDNGEGKVRYLEYEEGTHDFVAFPSCEPERSEALEAVKAWEKETFEA
ncbi:alpha/beta-hydrolase [Ramaria rubella]|nr:alpha/beta-hydrolase [Ramaria rubella]